MPGFILKENLDTSDDATDFDNDMTPDNETGGGNDPTILPIPELAVTKALTSSTPLLNGIFELTFRFNVENTGNTRMSNLTLSDPLPFAPAVIGMPTVTVTNIDATIPPNANFTYDGNGNDDLLAGNPVDRLEAGQSFRVDMTVEVDPSAFGALVQPVENQSTATGIPVDDSNNPLSNPTTGIPYIKFDISDTSDDGTGLPDGGDPSSDNPGAANDSGVGSEDDPTVISLPAVPQMEKAMAALPAALPNGNYSVTYLFTIDNVGGSELCQLGLEEDFASQFGCAFVGVLNTTAPAFSINLGGSILPTANSLYNGNTQTNLLNNDGCLYPGDQITASVTVEINPACAGISEPLANTATLSGEDTNSNPLTDDSDDATDLDGTPGADNETGNLDDPTLLDIPRVGVAKQQTGSTLLPNGNFVVTYSLVLQNTGNVTLNNVALEDDLATEFNPAFVSATTVSISGTANNLGALNGTFTGTSTTGSATVDGDDLLDRTGIMKPGETIVVEISVEINPTLVPPIGLTNQATGTASTPDGDNVTDTSDSGSDPIGTNGNGGPDDPTPLDLGPVPAITKAVNGVPTLLPNGNYLVRYDFAITNNGAGEMCNMDVFENLASQLGCAFISTTTPQIINWDNTSTNSTQPGFNTAFNGNTNDNLLIGDGCIFPGDAISFYIEVELDVACSSAPAPLANTATVSVEDTNGNVFTDDSDDSTDLNNDMTPDNDSGGEGDPTIVHVPELAMTKAVIGSAALANGNLQMDFPV